MRAIKAFLACLLIAPAEVTTNFLPSPECGTSWYLSCVDRLKLFLQELSVSRMLLQTELAPAAAAPVMAGTAFLTPLMPALVQPPALPPVSSIPGTLPPAGTEVRHTAKDGRVCL